MLEFIYESLITGGFVMIPIGIVSIYGWYLALVSFRKLGWQNKNTFLNKQKILKNPEKLISIIFVLKKEIPTISLLGKICPLLGLLGTVVGMITTFDVITDFGSGNPILMSKGISEALITTQTGLLAALPLIIWANYLKGQVNRIEKCLEYDCDNY
ncbi:MAG: MotA/TolQ/ExbB proton channel family protein [Pseudomonadota bacterium]